MSWLSKHTWLLAQDTHFGYGLAFTFGAKALGFPAWYGAAVILGVDFIKEMTFDILVEKETVKAGLVDWGFYILGCVVAFLILY